jgi:hypothetical protein
MYDVIIDLKGLTMTGVERYKDFITTSFNTNFSKKFKQYNGVKPVLNIQLHKLLPKAKQNAYKLYWYNNYKKVL